MSTLKEQAQIIRNEMTPGANTAARIGDMFVKLVDEVDKKINTSAISNNTGNSTTLVMGQKGVTDAINSIDKVYFTTLDITTKVDNTPISAEDLEELNKIFASDKIIYCNGVGMYTTRTDGIWDKYIDCIVGSTYYSAYIGSNNWSITKTDLGSSGGSSASVVQTTGASTTAVMSQNAVTTELNKKQNTLVSGTNIKTINGSSILGSGNIEISGTGGGSEGGISDAPTDGSNYCRRNGMWVKAVGKDEIYGDGTGEIFNDYTKNKATGQYSHAEGISAQSTGKYSHAEGYNCKASGDASHAEGMSTKALGPASHAEGSSTQAIGDSSHAEGYQTIANNYYEHASGIGNKSNNGAEQADQTLYSIGFGDTLKRKNAVEVMRNGDMYVQGIGDYDGTNYSEAKTLQESVRKSINEAPSDGTVYGRRDGTWTKTVGRIDPNSGGTGEVFNNYTNNKATGQNSHAEGAETLAEKDSAHAEGFHTTANNNYTHAEGCYTKASGDSAHAEGVQTIASGSYSHAEGGFVTASGSFSHAGGHYTIASNYSQTSIGTGNITDDNPSPLSYNAEKRSFVIGNGKTDYYGSSSEGDAFRVFFNGKVESDLNYSTPAADYAEMFEWKDGNTNHEDRVGLFVTLDGENIVLANSNSTYILGIISAVPAVLGDSPIQWQGKYLNDDWGRPIYEDVEYTEVKKVFKEDGTIEEVKENRTAHIRKINPDYNQDETYESRADRPEWDAVGMLGKLLVKHDGTLIQGGFCKPSDNGVATKSDSGYYVMKVVNGHQALVLFR